jgi:hypothetical protein
VTFPAQREAGDRQPRREPRERVQHRHHVAVEAGVVGASAERLAGAGAAHVHARDVPAARERQRPERQALGALGRSAEAVHDQERRMPLARVLPARAHQQPHVALGVDDQLLHRVRPGEPAARPVAEQRLAMSARGPGRRLEGQQAQGRGPT